MAKVINALSAGNVRPLTDTVTVSPVYEIDYAIAGTITLFADAEPAGTMAAVNAAAADFAIALASRIQRDIVPSQIIEALSVPGVYQVTLVSPLYTQLLPGQWANCIEIVLARAAAGINS
jgi:phage-related baseplate assembly protein